MSHVVQFPGRRASVRAVVLDQTYPDLGPEEAEFLAALSRIVARTRAEELWDKYRGPSPDHPARILARYAD